MNILVTGGLGKTAEPVLDCLAQANHIVTAFDISENGKERLGGKISYLQGDVCDDDTVDKAVNGQDAVIHLAVNVTDIQDAETTFRTNVFGTYTILRHAHKNRVKKVLIASSAPVHLTGESRNIRWPLGTLCSPSEDFAYDLTKCIQELTAEQFYQTYSMDILILRLGHIVDGKKQTDPQGISLAETSYCRGGWVCKYDVARAFVQAVEADFSGFHSIDIIGSFQAENNFDLTRAKSLIGFECEEKFSSYGLNKYSV